MKNLEFLLIQSLIISLIFVEVIPNTMAQNVQLHIEGSAQFDKTGPTPGRLILNTPIQEDNGRYGIQFSNNTIAPFVGDDIADQNYDFYSYWSHTRMYDAYIKIHGKSVSDWGRFLELTHSGDDGFISTDVGNLSLMPSYGNGNVGIRTDDPIYPLHVECSGFTGILLNGDNTGDAQIRIQNTGGGNHYLFDDISESNALGVESSGNLLFNTKGNNERMRIDTNGYVGINISDPGVRFNVCGNHLRLTDNDESRWIQFRADGDALDLEAINDPLYVSADGFIALGVGNENVGVGTDNPMDKFQVGEMGDGSEARANSWALFSDQRWKKDLVEIDEPIGKLSAVTGYYYHWKEGDDQSRQMGLVAQEVEAVMPEIVSTDAQGYKSLDYAKIVAVLIEAIKEQQSEIEDLKEQLGNLKSDWIK